MLAREKWQIKTIAVLERVFEERCAQAAKHGVHGSTYDFEDGTGPHVNWTEPVADGQDATTAEAHFRAAYEVYKREHGLPTWRHLVIEEVSEAFKESDPERLVEELLQVAALCVSWVEKIEQRT